MGRLGAAGVHFLASVLVVGLIATALVLLWFPPEYQKLLGVHALLAIITALAIASGPLLTLIVFDRRKRGLKFDIAIIVLAQVSLLGYGLVTAAAARPVYLVAVVDQFHLVTAAEIDDEALEEAAESDYASLPWAGPVLVGAELPADPRERQEVLWSALAGRDIQLRPRYYVPYERVAAEVAMKGGVSVADFRHALTADQNQSVDRAIGGRPPESLTILPLLSSRGIGAVVLARPELLQVATLEFSSENTR